MDGTELYSPDKLLLLLLLGPTDPPLGACPPITLFIFSAATLASSDPDWCACVQKQHQMPVILSHSLASVFQPGMPHACLLLAQAGRSGDISVHLLPYQPVISRMPVLYWFSLINTLSDFTVTKTPIYSVSSNLHHTHSHGSPARTSSPPFSKAPTKP